jgi:hypothetical protein
MRINVNAFIAVVLCTALLGGLWLLNTRNVLDDGVWNPHDMYNSVGGSGYSLSNVSSERSASSGTALTLPSLRTISHKASSVPYHLMASSPYSPIASSPYGSIASSPLSYASSDAQFHSFGGGGSADGVIGGSLRANPEAMPSATSLSMPSMSNYAMVARSQNAEMMQGEVAAVSALTSVAQSANALYSYDGIGVTALDYGCYASLGSPLRGISQRKNVSIQDQYAGWLNGAYAMGGGLTYYQLRDLYVEMTGDTDFTNESAWWAFYDWFMSKDGTDGFSWSYVPMADAIPFLLLLSLLYVCALYRKMKKQVA